MANFTYIGPASARVVQLTNVHLDATDADIRDFFNGYTVLDQNRVANPQTGINSVVYVMFASIQERDNVVATFRSHNILGRRGNIFPARSGNYVVTSAQDGFVRPGDTSTGVILPPPHLSANESWDELFPPHIPPPYLENPEDIRSRVLLITGIPTEVDNDGVMAFLQDYRPEAIDRAEIGGNRMLSALVVMQTIQGRDLAAERMNGMRLQGQRVVVQTFNNVTQEVLDRIMNPETAISNVAPSRTEPSEVTNSQNPSGRSIPYTPFGSTHTRLPDPPFNQRPRLNLARRNPSSDQAQAKTRPEPTRNDRESSPHHQSSIQTRDTEQHPRPAPRSNTQPFNPRQATPQSNGPHNIFPNNYHTTFPALPNRPQYTPLGTSSALVLTMPMLPNAPRGASARPLPHVPRTHPHPQHPPPVGNQGNGLMTAEAMNNLRINQAQADLDRVNQNADHAYRFANGGRGGRGRGRGNGQGRG